MKSLATALTMFALTVTAEAQIGALVAGNVGSDLITEARQTASTLIGQAEASGNALILRNATELNVLATNASLLLGSELTDVVGDMSVENRALMNALALATQTAQETVASATYQMRDAITLDLRGVIAGIGIGEQFYVQRITGLTQLEKDSGEYRVSISGLGLGIPTDKRRATLRLLINDKTSPRITAMQPDANTTIFSIPADVLAQFFAPKRMTVLRAAFDITYEYKSGLIFSRSRTLQQRVPVRIALMPAHAGTITVTATTDVREWVFLRSEVDKKTTGNHHCESDCRGEPTRTNYMVTIKVPSTGRGEVGDQKLTNPKLRCMPEMVNIPEIRLLGAVIGAQNVDASSCPWSAVNSVYLSEGDTRATGSFDVWSKPSNWELTADVHEYRVVREEQVARTYDLYFGRLVEIIVPKATTLAKISGKLITNARFELVAGNNDAQNLMKLEREVPTELDRKFVYLVHRPAMD
jgi:hypothetical protein